MIRKILYYILESFSAGKDRTQMLKRNIVWSVLIRFFAIGVEIVKVPILLSYLDSEKYGVWLTIVSIVMWTQHFDLGLGTGLRYKFTESLALNDKSRGKRLISTAYFSMAGIMFFVFLMSLLFIFDINWNSILNVSSIASNELQKTVLLILSVFVFQFIFELISTILKADQRAAISDVFKPIASVLSLIVIVLLGLFSSNSLFLASIAMTLPYILVLLIMNLYFFSKHFRDYKPSLKFFDKSCLKDIYSLGLKFFIGQLSALVVFSSANILLSRLINPSEVAVYHTAYTYYTLALVFFTVINVPLFSAITDAYVRKDVDWIRNVMKKMNYIAALFSLGIVLMLLISSFAFKIWVGDKLTIPVDLSISLSIFSILAVFVSPYNNFLGGVGKLNVLMIVSAFKIVLFIPVAIVCIKNFGIVGLVLAIISLNTLPNFIFGSIQYRMIINNQAKGIWNK